MQRCAAFNAASRSLAIHMSMRLGGDVTATRDLIQHAAWRDDRAARRVGAGTKLWQ
jgi:hypothetical protein